jgi:hypothetical protein
VFINSTTNATLSSVVAPIYAGQFDLVGNATFQINGSNVVVTLVTSPEMTGLLRYRMTSDRTSFLANIGITSGVTGACDGPPIGRDLGSAVDGDGLRKLVTTIALSGLVGDVSSCQEAVRVYYLGHAEVVSAWARGWGRPRQQRVLPPCSCQPPVSDQPGWCASKRMIHCLLLAVPCRCLFTLVYGAWQVCTNPRSMPAV